MKNVKFWSHVSSPRSHLSPPLNDSLFPFRVPFEAPHVDSQHHWWSRLLRTIRERTVHFKWRNW